MDRQNGGRVRRQARRQPDRYRIPLDYAAPRRSFSDSGTRSTIFTTFGNFPRDIYRMGGEIPARRGLHQLKLKGRV